MTVRIFYEKTGRAKYISHLDMMRCMTRSLSRSGLPVWYTQGFNPHIYLTFALPLSLGTESLWEAMDFKLEEELPMEEVASRLDACMPQGIRVLRAALPVEKADAIAWADYTVTMTFDGRDAGPLGEAFAALCGQEEILVQKRTKKGDKEVDIRPLLTLLGWEAQGERLTARLRMAAGGTTNINPSLLLGRFFDQLGMEADYLTLCKTAVLTGDLKPFE